MHFFRLLPKISPNLGYIFTHRPSYFKVLDPPLQIATPLSPIKKKMGKTNTPQGEVLGI
jgi:hypothetical protein